MNTNSIPFLSGVAALALVAGIPAPAMAQAGASDDGITDEGEIIVTARRREETAQETPVPVTVLNDALLDRYGMKGVASIQSQTPGLFTGESSGAMGGTISLRGIGSGDSMAFIDQAISTNVDGVPISSAQILRAAQMDLRQIEVLRGPQALFFGKNSPGGIISLVTANPGDRIEAMLRAGYEIKADEKYVEGMFSAPLSDAVGLRVAARVSHMDGYMDIVTPKAAGVIPINIKRFPTQDEIFLRGTLVITPSDRLKLTLKSTITYTDMTGGSSNFSDIVYCPYGRPQRPSEDASNCRNDGNILISQLPPAFMALSPYLTNPNGDRTNQQQLFSGTLEYDLSDALSLTSVTGYYGIKERLTSNGGYGPVSNNGFAVRFNNKQFTQELRLASDYDGALNFVAGGFYEDRKLYTLTMIGVPQFLLRLPIESTHQDQKSYSAFGQLLFDATDTVQLTLGGRYTRETKNLRDFTVTPVVGGQYATPVDVTTSPLYGSTKLKFNNFSPEATVTWKPVDDVMIFASYKRGFKSGGFDAGYTNAGILANPARSQRFNPEKVQGGELGIKSQFADRQVTVNLTGYWYDYKGLQVSLFDTVSRAFRLQNAARARVRGLELETRFKPAALPGLSLHATAAWNDSEFRNYLSDCYQGQTVALGCNRLFNPAANQITPPNGASRVNGVWGFYTAQDLSGKRLRKAPRLAATFGGYYEGALAEGLMFSLSGDLSYSGGYEYGTNYQSWAWQKAYTKVDATLRLFTEDKAWELAVIGRNLTNKRSLINGIDRTGTGGVAGVSAANKGSNLASCTAVGQAGCSAAADLIGTPTLPRTVALQLTWRY